MSAGTVSIARRFCGPTRSGNGGYTCGRLAATIEGTASVRLMAPPPLDTELQVARADGTATLLHDGKPIAQARPAVLELSPPPPPRYADAEAASAAYLGFRSHPFPRCFVCGPERSVGDGLRIFPGAHGEPGVVAATWVPDASLATGDAIAPEFLWAAIDCTSGVALMPSPPGLALVLGELTTRIDATLRAGDRCVVVGRKVGVDGRKHRSEAAIYRETGEVVAVGRAVWIEVPVAAFEAANAG